MCVQMPVLGEFDIWPWQRDYMVPVLRAVLPVHVHVVGPCNLDARGASSKATGAASSRESGGVEEGVQTQRRLEDDPTLLLFLVLSNPGHRSNIATVAVDFAG